MTAALAIASDGATLARVMSDPAFAAIDRHPFTGRFGRRYYPAVGAGQDVPCGFVVLDGAKPLLYAPATLHEQCVSHHGMALRLFLAEGLGAADVRRTAEVAFAHLEALAPGFVIETEAGATLDAIAECCLARSAAAAPRITATVSLSSGEPARRSALRKSFRALVNWGRRAITLRYVNGASPDRDAFAHYQRFHRRVAGRVTRPQESWDAMFDVIASGGGELALGHLEDGTLVSATLVVDGSSVSYYASGVYDRERFDKPMAHWPLWNAIERAAARGLALFDLGEVPLPGAATEKEIAIGYFKRGFAMALHPSLVWTRQGAA